MTYVDPIFETPRTRKWPYDHACHLLADSVDELVDLAVHIGLKREYLQTGGRFPHFDLTDNMRRRAVAAGAKELDMRETAQLLRGMKK